MAKVEVKMAVDPFQVIASALKKSRKHLRLQKIVSVDYGEEADVLYARFAHRKIVDSESLDDDGMVLAALDSKQHMIGLTIIQTHPQREWPRQADCLASRGIEVYNGGNQIHFLPETRETCIT